VLVSAGQCRLARIHDEKDFFCWKTPHGSIKYSKELKSGFSTVHVIRCWLCRDVWVVQAGVIARWVTWFESSYFLDSIGFKEINHGKMKSKKL